MDKGETLRDGRATRQRKLGHSRLYGKEQSTALACLSLWALMWESKELPFLKAMIFMSLIVKVAWPTP